MRRKNLTDKKEIERLDKVNNGRVEICKKQVIEAIKLLDNPVNCIIDGFIPDNAVSNIAHATNLIDSAQHDLLFACEYYSWNMDVCDLLDESCKELGICMAIIYNFKEDTETDILEAADVGNKALSLLGKSLAALINWFDEDEIN